MMPYPQSPRRAVPASIPRPHYVDRPAPDRYTGSHVQTPETIELMRESSRIASDALYEAAKAIAPGVTTDRLDAIAHEYMLDHGAYPSTLGYRNFPKAICTSINEVICHGIPSDRVLIEGDIINVDVTSILNGYYADANMTFFVGKCSDEAHKIVNVARESLKRGLAMVVQNYALFPHLKVEDNVAFGLRAGLMLEKIS